MTVLYALLAKTIEPPTPEILVRAFRGVPGLAAADALIAAQSISAILMRGLTADQVLALSAGFKDQGIQTETVPESSLPVLPPARLIRSVEFGATHLKIHEACGRRCEFEWDQVGLLAAGKVQEVKIQRTRREWKEVKTDHIGIPLGHVHVAIPIRVVETKSEYRSRESDQWGLRLEILKTGGAARFVVEAENFQFGDLACDASADVQSDFCFLVKELAARASNSARNRGVAAIMAGAPAPVCYLRRAAFQNEMIWMLWQQRRTLSIEH
jgi:hypothetical protein